MGFDNFKFSLYSFFSDEVVINRRGPDVDICANTIGSDPAEKEEADRTGDSKVSLEKFQMFLMYFKPRNLDYI